MLILEKVEEKSKLELNGTTQNMLDVGPLIMGLDAEGNIIFFNDKCEEVTGYSEEEVLGKPIWEFFPEDTDEKEIMDYLMSTDRGDLSRFKVIPWVSKEDKKRPIKWKTIQLKGVSGNLETVIVIGLDIKEFESAYGDLGKTAPIFETIVENIDSGIFVTYRSDGGLVIQANNSKLEEILGYSQEELKGERLDAIFSSEDLKQVRNNVEDVIEDSKSKDIQVQSERKDGKKIWVEARLIPIEVEDKSAVLGMVSETEKPEEIIDHANIGIVIVQNEEISYLNKRAADIFESSKEEFMEEGILNYIHPEDKDDLQFLEMNKIEEGVPFSQEFRIITQSGKVRYLSTEAVQITYNGEPATQVILEEITKYKEMEKRLRDRRKELSEAYTRLRETQNKLRDRKKQLEKTSETRSEFIDLVAHEFSSLLTPAKTYVEILSAEEIGELNDKQKEKLEQVKNKFGDIEKLVKDMLDLSRIEADKIKADNKSVSVKDILTEVIEECQDEIERKNHELDVEISENLPDIVGGPRLLEKVFRNLISNAVQYTPSTGEIAVRAEPEEENVHISVSDNGVGLTEEEQENIFQKFYRAEPEEEEKKGGLGIGLAITKHFVELHDGEIWVESEKGEGTTFHVLLPI